METIESCRVQQLDESGNVIATYESVREAARVMGCMPERIIAALKGRQETSCEFRWRYEKCHGKTMGRNRSIGVVQKTLDGRTVKRHRSIQSAAKSLRISPSGIWKCLNGKRKTDKGYIWERDPDPIGEYENAEIPVEQFTADGDFLMRFHSVSEAARCVGKNTGDICRCLKGRRKTCGGFQWKYA